MKQKLIIGLPTFNEAINIERTAKTVDQGLSKIPNIERIIVNADNDSPDGTSRIFSNLELNAKKEVITNANIGKGVNILSILQFAQTENADAIVLLDSDVTSITPEWVDLLSKDILAKKVDAIFPAYRRSRYDGTATIQLIIPVLAAVSGKLVSQPIGGEFSFSRKVIDQLVPKINQSANGYGIDICITSTILSEDFKYKEGWLGEKVHRPGQDKISQLFLEVFNALSTFLPSFQSDTDELLNGYELKSITHKPDVLSSERVVTFEDEYRRTMGIALQRQDMFFDKQFFNKDISMEDWIRIISNTILALHNNMSKKDDLSIELLPLFLKRNLTFWQETESLTPREVEGLILDQAKLLREELVKLFKIR